MPRTVGKHHWRRTPRRAEALGHYGGFLSLMVLALGTVLHIVGRLDNDPAVFAFGSDLMAYSLPPLVLSWIALSYALEKPGNRR